MGQVLLFRLLLCVLFHKPHTKMKKSQYKKTTITNIINDKTKIQKNACIFLSTKMKLTIIQFVVAVAVVLFIAVSFVVPSILGSIIIIII